MTKLTVNFPKWVFFFQGSILYFDEQLMFVYKTRSVFVVPEVEGRQFNTFCELSSICNEIIRPNTDIDYAIKYNSTIYTYEVVT